MLRGRFFFPLLLAVAALAAACGGGGGGTPPVAPSPAASTTPHAGPTQVPVGPSPQAVDISGDGYTLSFDLPPVVTGTVSTATATLQTALPSGTTMPQGAKRGYTPPRPLAQAFSGLVYLIISTKDTVGFAYAPSFQFQLPANVSIPNGSTAYILFWDPYQSGSTGWIPLIKPGTVNGQVVSFKSIATGVQFDADTQYDFALAYTTQTIPTATPAPTPTPTPPSGPSASPSAAPTPAYCAGISTPVPNGNSIPQKVYIKDNSGTGAQVVLYVVSGAPPAGSGGPANQTQYLATNGQMTNFTPGATAPPLPLACFPGSTGGTGMTFELPPPTYKNQSGNFYIALADGTPNPSGTPPNPLSFMGGATPTPAPGQTSPPDGFGNSQPGFIPGDGGYVSTPFDDIEYTLPSSTTDVTQVDKVGLPLEVWQGTSGPHIGFAEGQLGALLSQLTADQKYAKLAVSSTMHTTLGTRTVLARILAPKNADGVGFAQDYFYNSSVYGPNGFIAHLLQEYQTTPQLYTLSGVAVTSQTNYCAGSDGHNVLFYSVGSGKVCTGNLGAPTYTMQVYNTLEGTTQGTDSYNVCYSAVFSAPYGAQINPPFVATVPPNNYQDEFYLWKAMVTDLNRGVADTNGTHPIGTWSTAAGAASWSTFTPAAGAFYNKYWYWLHEYMISNEAYAFAYDEPGGLAPSFNADTSQSLYVTIHNIPSMNPTGPPVHAPSQPCPSANP